jgi:transcriptional regulator with GAF, ATPase, and Fis domain
MSTTRRPDPGVSSGERADDGAVDLAYERVLVELTGIVVDTPSTGEVLEQLIEIARRSTTASTAISVTAHDDGEYHTAATTSSEAQEVDEHEYVTETGPCVDAIETGRLQVSDDVLEDDRWPSFSAVAADKGYRSVAGIPLVAAGRTVGALDLYAAEPGDVRELLPLAERLAAPIATVVANALALRRMSRLGEHLQHELDQLATVEQAIGVLMAQRSWDGATAERALERTAEATGRPIDDVALRIVRHARGRRLPPP